MEVEGYVRQLITGKIYKILEIFYLSEELNIKYFKTGKFTGFNSYEQFEYKYSSNIKELIQEGDIIKWKTKDNSYYGINEVIKRLKGILCGNKGTSCPDQLAKALEEMKTK